MAAPKKNDGVTAGMINGAAAIVNCRNKAARGAVFH
jgi:hypothetical protein